MTNIKTKHLVKITGLLILMSMQVSRAQDIKYYKGQALFIWNFTKHIKLTSPSNSFVIGIYGKSDIIDELSFLLKGKAVESKPVEIKSINSIAEASLCQMVYVPTSKSKDLQNLITAITSKDIVLITEDDLAEKGAGISFVIVENKLKFKVNQQMLSKGGVQVDGILLSLAARII